MTGREVINSKLVQIRRFLFLGLLAIPIVFCLSLIFGKHSAANLLSAFFPLAVVPSYGIWVFYRTIFVQCPFCNKKIPWDFNEHDFRLLSNDYKYCPYCRSGLDGQVNEETKRNCSDNLQKPEAGKQNNSMTGRIAINANISKKRVKHFIVSGVIGLALLSFFWWGSIDSTYLLWMTILGLCLVIGLLVNALSWTKCPFCGKRICLSIKDDKWKLEMDFLFCHCCGAPIDQQLYD